MQIQSSTKVYGPLEALIWIEHPTFDLLDGYYWLILSGVYSLGKYEKIGCFSVQIWPHWGIPYERL